MVGREQVAGAGHSGGLIDRATAHIAITRMVWVDRGVVIRGDAYVLRRAGAERIVERSRGRDDRAGLVVPTG